MPRRFHYVYYSYEEFGRGYIGSRSCKANPHLGNDAGYFGSFTDKSFHPTEKVILGYYETAKEALDAENKLMEFYDVANNPHFANKQVSPYEWVGNGNGMLGRRHTEESKQLMREVKLGKTASEETKRKMSETRRGKPSGANPANISAALKGRVFTQEHCDKISVAKKGKPTGRRMSEEHKRKMSEARWKNKRKKDK